MHNRNMLLTPIAGRNSYDGITINTYVADGFIPETLTVYQSGMKLRNTPGHLSGPAVYDHYILHFILSGSGRFLRGIQEFSLSAGDIFLISPYESVRYQASTDDPYRYLWVGFNGPEAASLLKGCGFLGDNFIIHPDKSETFVPILQKIAAIHTADNADHLLLTGLLYEFFSALTRLRNTVPIGRDPYVDAATRYIHNRLTSSDLSVTEIAAYVGVNRSHLFRLFRTARGISIQNYILGLRINRAKALLLQSDASIASIASECGFSNLTYFSQYFKKRVGLSPKTYRTKGE